LFFRGNDTVISAGSKVLSTATGSFGQGLSDAVLVGGSHLLNIPAGIADGVMNMREGKSFWDKGVTGERLENWQSYVSYPGELAKRFFDYNGMRTGSYPTTFNRSNPTQEKMYQESVNGITNAIETPSYLTGNLPLLARGVPRLPLRNPATKTLALTEKGEIPSFQVNPKNMEGNLADINRRLSNPLTSGGRINVNELQPGDVVLYRGRYTPEPLAEGSTLWDNVANKGEYGFTSGIRLFTDSPYTHAEVVPSVEGLNKFGMKLEDYYKRFPEYAPNQEVDVFRFNNATEEFRNAAANRAWNIGGSKTEYPRSKIAKNMPNAPLDFLGLPQLMEFGVPAKVAPVNPYELDKIKRLCSEIVGDSLNLKGVNTKRLAPKNLAFLPGTDYLGRLDTADLMNAQRRAFSNLRTNSPLTSGVVLTGDVGRGIAENSENQYNTPLK
jgi:hypothetical protein